MALQRELEQFKQLGISSNRKMSRVGRAVLDSNKILDGSERKTLPKPIDSEDLSKENVSLNLGNGGISFVVE